MKRKLKWTAVVLVVSLLGFGTASLLWPRDRITADSYAMIKIGMTEKEVEDILGAPRITSEEWEAQHRTLRERIGKEPFIPDGIVLEEPKAFSWEKVKCWIDPRRGIMQIQFDEAGHVSAKLFQGGQYLDLNFLDRLRDWLGW